MALPSNRTLAMSEINKGIQFTNGNVGIGTTSPSAKLDVNGSAIISTGLTTASAQITNSLVAIGTSNTIGSIITTGGNVGIGTVNPGSSLHVAGTMGVAPLNSGIHMGIDSNANAGIQLNAGGDTVGNCYIDFGFSENDNTTRILHTNLDNSLQFAGPGGYVYLASTGNVGISSSSPSAKLDVDGSAIISTGLTTGKLLTTDSSGIQQSSHTGPVITERSHTISSGSLSSIGSYGIFKPTSTQIAIACPQNVNGAEVVLGTIQDDSTFIYAAHLDRFGDFHINTSAINLDRFGNITATGVVSSGTLSAATGITSASAQITNINATSITSAGLAITNFNTTNITSASAQITNINATSITSAGFAVTNFNTTNITTQSLLVTGGGLRATFNSNTIGNILFTTGGNIGINTTTPKSKFDVNETAVQVRNGYTYNITAANQQTSQLILGNISGAYSHAIKTRHYNSGNDAGNSIDFYVWQTSQASNTAGNKHVLSVGSAGVGIFTTSPSYTLDVNGTARFSDTLYVGGNTTSNMIAFHGTAGDSAGEFNQTFIAEYNIGASEGPINELLLFKGTDGGDDRIRLLAPEFRFDTTTAAGGDINSVANFPATNRFIIKTSGNVGIGTTSPSFTLDVNGTAMFSSGVTSGPLLINASSNTFGQLYLGNQVQNRSIVMYQDATNDHQFYGFGVNAYTTRYQIPGTTGFAHRFFAATSATSSNEIMTITGTGNVGIGTTDPNMGYSSTIGNVSLALLNGVAGGDGGTSTILIGGNSRHYSSIVSTHINGGSTFLAFGTANGPTNPSERMRITNAGNVGIGTTSPSYTLDVNGTAKFSDAKVSSNGVIEFGLGITKESNAGKIGYGTFTTDTLDIVGGGTGGNRMIKMWETLNVVQSIITTSAQITGNSNTIGSIITTGGNVGIGTTAPNFLLDVNGSAKIRGQILAMYDLDSVNSFHGLGMGNSSVRLTVPSSGSHFISFGSNTGGNYAEQMRITNAGNVGIGTTAPAVSLHVVSSGFPNIRLQTSDPYVNAIEFDSTLAGQTGGKLWRLIGTHQNAGEGQGKFVIQQVTNGLSPFTINSSGNVGINRIAPTYQLDVDGNFNMGGHSQAYFMADANVGDGRVNVRDYAGTCISFYISSTKVGSITASGSTTSYNTSSDYRLKENVVTLTNALSRVSQIPVHRFNFISTPDKTVDGFIAHEVADIVPEAIHGEKDAVDDDGNIIAQGIDQSKLVPLLTAAIKELKSEIDSIKTHLGL
jgi:hypothetical protein